MNFGIIHAYLIAKSKVKANKAWQPSGMLFIQMVHFIYAPEENVLKGLEYATTVPIDWLKKVVQMWDKQLKNGF